MHLIICVLCVPFSIIQHLMHKKCSCKKWLYVPLLFLNIILSFPLLLLFVATLIVFGIYRCIISTILRTWHGTRFKGLITGLDSLVSIYSETSGAISLLAQIETTKIEKAFVRDLINKLYFILASPSIDRKIFCVRKRFMGYEYFHELNDCGCIDILKIVHLENTDIYNEKMCDKLYQLMIAPLPKNDKFNWDITLCTTPKTENITKNTFFLLFRMHHTVGDVLSIRNFLTKYLLNANKKSEKYSHEIAENLMQRSTLKKFNTKLAHFLLTSPKPNNAIFSNEPHKHVVFTFKVTKGGDYVRKIKEIKRKFEGVSFFNVFLTALSASLCEFFIDKSGENIPKTILLTSTAQLFHNRFVSCTKMDNLQNDFTMFALELPIRISKSTQIGLDYGLIVRLKLIQTELLKIMKSFDTRFFYAIFRTLMEVLPSCIASKVKSVRVTGLLSSLPVGPELELYSGDRLKSILGFFPKHTQYGFILTMCSYEGELGMALAMDRKKLNHTEATKILENVLKYIDLLYENTKGK